MKTRRLYNRLGQIMENKHLNQKMLAEKSNLSTRTISRILHGNVESIDFDTLEKLCRALGVQPGEIFCIDLSTIWTRARKIGAAVTHIASGVCPKCTASSAAGALDGRREACGRWDVIATYEMTALIAAQAGIKVEEHMHSNATFPTGPLQPGLPHFTRDGRVHVIFGSPASNKFAEEVIAREIYGVPPGSPANIEVFPYALVFPKGHVVSAFSIDGELDKCGIIDTRTRQLVAHRTFVPEGGGCGQDCALLIVMRTRPLNLDTSDPSDGEGMIICCCGHSGPATLACTRILADPQYAAELFPKAVGKPIMRVVTAEYVRPSSTKLADIRELTSYELLPAGGGGRTTSRPATPLHVAN